MKLMENIMKNDSIKNSINEKFKKNNKDILKELNHYKPYIKYCIILDVEKPTSQISTGSIIRRRMLTQEGGKIDEIIFRICIITLIMILTLFFIYLKKLICIRILKKKR